MTEHEGETVAEGSEPDVDDPLTPGTNGLVHPDDGRPDMREMLKEPLTQRPTIRIGAYAWACIGIAIVTLAAGYIVGLLSSVVIPVVLALFPAAVLYPMVRWLKSHRVPAPLAAAIVLLGTLGVVGSLGALIAPAVAEQLDTVGQSLRDGYEQLDTFLRSGPFGLDPINLDRVIEGISESLSGGMGEATSGALGVARAFFEGATSVILTLIVLFFYLMDGPNIGRWVKTLFPQALHRDVEVLGGRMWNTIGGYIQGQLAVAFVDALFIGLGVWLLGVPLALPLGVLVFFGGLFPVVGAGISGSLAALVALATNGPGTALLVIVVVLSVQFLEGQLLQPLILGRALELHPLAIIVALAAGGFLLGILGAFLAVPVAAASAQTVGYIRNRVPG